MGYIKEGEEMTSITDLYTIGEYHVSTRKLDNCPLIEDQDNIEGWIWVALFLSFPISVIFIAMIYTFNPSDARICCYIYGAFVVLCLTSLLIFNITKDRCGLKITVNYRHNNTEQLKYYRFTDNVEKDAANIKKIVDKFIAKANALHKADEDDLEKNNRKLDAEKKHSEECCIRYKEVLDKVKK